jgi:hypothetical protein
MLLGSIDDGMSSISKSWSVGDTVTVRYLRLRPAASAPRGDIEDVAVFEWPNMSVVVPGCPGVTCTMALPGPPAGIVPCG